MKKLNFLELFNLLISVLCFLYFEKLTLTTLVRLRFLMPSW